MDELNKTFEKPEFDWSAISVGDYKLDHSQNFFAKNETNNNNLRNKNQQQIIFNNCATPKVSKFKEEPTKASPVQQEDIENMPEADAAPVTRSNLRMQWTPIRPSYEGGARAEDADAAAAAAPVPRAYAFKDLYECNRQQARRRQEEEDRQARQFQSRPMPNFKAMHKRMEDKVVVHRITVPRTPKTVKYWQACVERRRQAKRDNQDKEQSQEPVHPHTRHRTFNLHSDAVQERQVQKKKEQEEQRKRCEEEEIKEIRKMTVFKARPNPFK
ncbi:uncharacterized protein [Drosophila kikkawai]|uniref:Uncharacterized protein isoform X2 n=1 Tax=Drosophila kikkawai TaxID=30033 RepID=A0A6P4I5W9_DROKI|nr:uncharacterized protein LOC108076088 isoform X2 [Drosophila kikkawai]